MIRHTIVVLIAAALALALAIATAPLFATAAGTEDDPAHAAAVTALNAGIALFDARDAAGLAATYTEDAVLTLVGRDDNTHAVKTEVKHGRAEIESYYHMLFRPGSTYHAKSIVEFVRRLGPDMLMIAGHFEPDCTRPNPLKLPFVQVRVKQADAWRIMNLQVFVVPGG